MSDWFERIWGTMMNERCDFLLLFDIAGSMGITLIYQLTDYRRVVYRVDTGIFSLLVNELLIIKS